VVSVLFALLTALFNGLASVLQRIAAAAAPASRALHLSLFSYLIRRKVWLAGIGMVILASVCQATALATGPVALVQPIFIIELPFTLLVASRPWSSCPRWSATTRRWPCSCASSGCQPLSDQGPGGT